jgi:uncharacterized membrane protein YczE
MTQTALANLSPIEQLRAPRLPRRLVQLFAGLTLFGFSMAMMVRASLGLDPWDVLHAGLAEQTGLSFGTVVVVVGVLVLLLWIPLRQMPGLGTVANTIMIGVVSDVGLGLVTTPDGFVPRLALLLGGVLLNALAGALYIGSQLGPGPRDGLMTGLVRRTGLSVRLVRTSLEVTVLVAGFLLGGAVGLGTVVYALVIGPLVHWMLPWFTVSLAADPRASEAPVGARAVG